MSYHGDFALGSTFDIKFSTISGGVLTTLAGTPVISAYVDNNTTEITAGITLSADFDSRTGLNNVRVVATSGNGYATASNYTLVITTGTVGGTSVVGTVVGSFSIEARSALRPTTAARTLDVTATGEAGIDWANIGGPTTTVDLSNTTIKTTQKVDVDTIKTNPVVNGGTITFPTNATVASTTNITAATGISLTATTGLGNQTANITGNLSGSVGSVTGNVGGNVTGSVGSVVGLTASNLDTTVSSRLAPTTAGRTLDVTATGEAGIDWANVGTPGASVNLSNTIVENVAFVSNSNLSSINGDSVAGNNATLNLKQLNIVNNSGTALIAQSTGGNGNGAHFMGGTSGGTGLVCESASDNGSGIYTVGYGPNSHGIQVYAPVGASGMDILCDNGLGLQIVSNDIAVLAEAYGTNKDAILILSDDGGVSIKAPQGIIGSDTEDLSVTNVVDKIWDELIAGHLGAGTTGAALNGAGSAGDPWTTPIPGAYGAGTAGYIVGNEIKGKTDQLTFTNPGEVDANIQAVNDTELTGDGSGTPWGPA